MIAVCAIGAAAQTIKINPKFGNVSKEELEMNKYAPDTSALAVILYKSSDTKVRIDFHEGTFTVTEKVHSRIKILKDEGKKYANFELAYMLTDDKRERIYDIKVETINFIDGKVKRTKMSKKYIFDEQLTEDYWRVSFAAENVMAGSVIDVEYILESPDYARIPDRILQEDIPINLIETTFSYPEFFTYKKTQRTLEHISYDLKEEKASVTLGMSTINYHQVIDKFTATDMPAIINEGYSFNSSQYRSRISYDLGGVFIPGIVNKTFNKNWEAVDQYFIKAGILKECFSNYRNKEDLMAAIAGIEDDEQKIVAIRKYVLSQVKWDGSIEKVPSPAKDILKKGHGDSADINMLVASALNTVGFTAEPVFIRSRSEGILATFQVTSRAFNALILKVTSPNKSRSWYLDAARDDAYLNVLPPNYLIENARLITKKGIGSWVDLRNTARHKLSQSVSASLNSSGLLSGNSQTEASGSNAYSLKNKYLNSKSQETYLENLQNAQGLESISNFVFEDSYSPTASLNYNFEKESDVTGDRMYFKPFLTKYHSESDFRKEARKIPVDFEQPEDLSYVAIINLPKGWEVEEMPIPTILTCPPIKGRATFTCQEVEDKIVVKYSVTISNMHIPAAQYKDLRTFWEQLVNIERTIIVLKKCTNQNL
ncbi:MAG: transglutaminase domain-containing protein [Bacteroidales bacterium]|nr:transglutaminase domain-containing protein [Bacteroidales bacterium]